MAAAFNPELFEQGKSQGGLERLSAADRVDSAAVAGSANDSLLRVVARGILGRMALRVGSGYPRRPYAPATSPEAPWSDRVDLPPSGRYATHVGGDIAARFK